MTNTGHDNTGDFSTGLDNTGYYNTGHFNTGNTNTGNTNTGNRNTGNRNTGNRNTGNSNTGNTNAGHSNTGNFNTGHLNTGGCNTGNRNAGHFNTGNFNTGDYHVGCFNTVNAGKAYYFNKLIDRAEWYAADKPSWVYRVMPTQWVESDEMTKAEKAANPSHKTTGGYLRTKDMKQAWVDAFATATPEDIELTKALPGFDAEVFLEITGVDLRRPDRQAEAAAPLEGHKMCIDGVLYTLRREEKDT